MKSPINILFVVSIYPIFICLSLSNIYVNSETKETLANVVAQQIVKKIGEITESSLSTALPEEQLNVITAIKDKLNNAAKRFGKSGTNYVKLIMEGVKLMAFNYGKSKLKRIRSNIIRESASIVNLRKKSDNAKFQEFSKRLLHNIANKVQKLTDKHLSSAKNDDEKIKLLSVIRRRIVEMAKQKYVSASRNNKPSNTYVNLIKKGIDISLRKYIPLVANSMKNINQANQISEINDDELYNEVENTPSTTLESYVENDYTNLTIKEDCDNNVRKFCFKITNLNKISCSTIPILIPIDKLCDDHYDCPDRSDEDNCFRKVINRIQRVNKIISSVETSTIRSCFSAIDTTLLISQSKVLNNVILAQIEFLKKYATNSYIAQLNNRTVQTTANEVAIVLDSLTLALSGALCYSNVDDEVELPNRRFNEIIDVGVLDDELKEQTFRPVSCQCTGKDCTNKNCNKACHNTCWKKYSLSRWTCRAVDGESSITLDFICDGKPDCLNESDEDGCNYTKGSTKFEAIEIYNTIIKLLQEKESAKEYKSLHNEILALKNSVMGLLQASTSSSASSKEIKKARSECFSALVSTYNNSISNVYIAADIEDIYAFLLSINEKIVAALKNSNTGNEKVITKFDSDDNCECKHGKCVSNCVSKCIRYCEAKPKLTMYSCKDSKSNKSVIIEFICDGRENCPNGRDELDCKKGDICRRHHLVMLNNKIQRTGQLQTATVIGELIEKWTKKVNATFLEVRIDEFHDRPSPTTMKNAVSRVVADLLQAYVSFENRRRNNSDFLKELTKIAQMTMESLKSCGK